MRHTQVDRVDILGGTQGQTALYKDTIKGAFYRHVIAGTVDTDLPSQQYRSYNSGYTPTSVLKDHNDDHTDHNRHDEHIEYPDITQYNNINVGYYARYATYAGAPYAPYARSYAPSYASSTYSRYGANQFANMRECNRDKEMCGHLTTRNTITFVAPSTDEDEPVMKVEVVDIV